MKKYEVIELVIESILGIISVALIIHWYDWKLLVVLVTYGWYLNIASRRLMGNKEKNKMSLYQKYELYDKVRKETIGNTHPFLFDITGNIFMLTTAQGDGHLELINVNKGIELKEKEK